MGKRNSKKSLRRGLIEEIYNSTPMPEQPSTPKNDYPSSFNSGMSRDEIANIYNSYTPETQEIPTLKPNTPPTTSTPSIADELERMRKAKADTTTPRTEGEQRAIDTYYDSLMKASGQTPTTSVPKTDYKAEIDRMNALKADTTTPRTEGENKAIDTYLNSLVDAQRYLDSQNKVTNRSVKSSNSQKKVTQKNVKNIGTVEIKADGTKNYTKTMSANEKRDYERALMAQSKARGKALSAPEQRDYDRAQEAIAKAKEREKVTTTTVNQPIPTTAKEKTEELQFGQLKQKPKVTPTPQSMASDYVNYLANTGNEDVAKEYVNDVQSAYNTKVENEKKAMDAAIADYQSKHQYDERGFRTNESLLNEYIDPNKKLTKDEKKQAKALINTYLDSDPLARELHDTNNNNYALKLRSEMTPEQQDQYAKLTTLENKLNGVTSASLGVLNSVPFLSMGMDKFENAMGVPEEAQFSNMVGNARRQNPLLEMGGEFAGKATQYGMLNASPLANVGGDSALWNLARGQAYDTLLDTIPNISYNAYQGKYNNYDGSFNGAELAKDIAINQATNAAFNLGSEFIPRLWQTNRPTNVADIPRIENAETLNPLEMATKNANIDNAIKNQTLAIDNIENIKNELPSEEEYYKRILNDEDFFNEVAKQRENEAWADSVLNGGYEPNVDDIRYELELEAEDFFKNNSDLPPATPVPENTISTFIPSSIEGKREYYNKILNDEEFLNRVAENRAYKDSWWNGGFEGDVDDIKYELELEAEDFLNKSNDVIPRLETQNSPMGGDGNNIIPTLGQDVVEPRGKVSQYATNSMKRGTNLTPEEYQQNIDLKDFVYQDKTEKQSMADAFKMINDEGVDNLKARLLSDDATSLSQSEIDALMALTRTNNATARAMELAGEDASALRAETNAIYKKLRSESTSNAQALQALAKWTRNTPEGLLMSAENIVNGNTEVKGSKLQELLKKLKRYQKDYDFSPDFEKRFLTEAEKLESITDMDSREAKDIMARLGRMVNDEIPVKMNEKVQSFLMDNMLGNFRTLITRNAGGNVGLAGVEQVATRPLAAGIDRLVSHATGKRTQAGLTREGLSEYIQGFRKGLSDEAHDIKTGLHTARTGENTLEEAIRSNRHVFKNKIQDKFDSLVKNGLSIGDRPFYEANYKQTLGDYYRLRKMGAMGEAVQSLSDADFKTYAETAAKLNALASVYQNDSQISNALIEFKNAIGEFSEGTVGFDILSQFSMPFVKTPANVVDRAIDYSPLGIVRNTARTIKEGGFKGANFDQNRFVNETARNIIGTGLMAGAAGLANSGVINGAYSDNKNVKQAQKDSGMQEYALNIPGNLQMDIGWLPVVGSNAVAAAAAVDAFKNGEGGLGANLTKGLTAGGEALFDQSMFQGLQRLFGSGDSYDSEGTLPENMMNVVKSGFGQTIPSLVRQGAQVKDQYARDLGNSNKDLSFGIMDNYDINSLANNIPVLREKVLAPKVDLSGNLVQENQGRGLGSKILEDMILPGKITQVDVNPLDNEAIRLSEATGNEDAYRPKAYLKDVTLSNNDLVAYEQRFGKEITDIGNEIMSSDLYQNLDDFGKEKLLKESYDAIKSGINSEYTGKNVSGAAKAYVNAGGGEEGRKAVLEYEFNKNNQYGLSSDYYVKAVKNNEDLSKYEGYADVLSNLEIEDNKTYRDAYVSGGAEAVEKAKQASEYAKEAGTTISSGAGKIIQEAVENGDTQKAEEIVETSKTLSDYGLDKPGPTATYTKAQEVIPSLSVESFAKTYKAIDSDSNQGIKQGEIIDYLNRGNYSQTEGSQIWNAYGNGTWKKIPKLEDGTWKLVKK